MGVLAAELSFVSLPPARAVHLRGVCIWRDRSTQFFYATRVEIRNKDARRIFFLWCRGGIGRRRREMETGN